LPAAGGPRGGREPLVERRNIILRVLKQNPRLLKGAEDHLRQPQISYRQRVFLTLLACAFLSFSLVWVAIKTTKLNAGQMAIWPGDGLILAYMLGVLRRHPLLALLAGGLATVGAEIFTGNPALLSIPLFCFNALCIGSVFFYITKIAKFEDITNSKTFVFFLLLITASAALTALGVAIVAHVFYNVQFWATLLTSTMGNVTGCAVLTPLVLIITNPNKYKSNIERSFLQRSLIVSAYILLVGLVFFQSSAPILFLIPLGLMAVAYMTTFMTLALCVVATVVIALFGTLLGHGPINLLHGGNEAHLLMLQAFLVVITGTTLPIAALMAEHAKLKLSLIASRQEAEAANQAKSTFLATISHEIRTPLNGVLGMAQVIAMDELSDAQRERISIVRQSGEALLAILNDVLDFSKIEAGKLTLEQIEFDLMDLISASTKSYESLSCEKGLALNCELSGIEGIYLGDPTRIRQIIYNLISNAMKFTQQGSISVAATYQDEVLRLSVKDTGMGIPREKLATLFAKFTQVDASTTRKFGGTGLGLSICRELTELMGGSLTVESVEGEGSTFFLQVPLPRVSAAASSTDVAAAPAELSSEIRVLAAEDNPTNQLVLKTLLQFAGVEVAIVGNGQEAVEAWSSQAWDVILMDVQMPVMDGPTATREIRRRERADHRPRTPIIALTANTMSHQTTEYIECGMDDHVAKPIDAEALFEAIFKAIESRTETTIAAAV
jgi:signal transduction histidine kinase/ActR/RegA family two-component response regulator